MPIIKWEAVGTDNSEWIAKIPGGWLYKTRLVSISAMAWNPMTHTMAREYADALTITFIPDPNHEWEMVDLLHQK